MNKFAYLIMAHENSLVLKTLLNLLDDQRNDIYIHFDAKTKLNFKEELVNQVQKSQLFFTDVRVDVKWADISQVEAEYILFETAYRNYKYSYFHLLSGSDLPLKSQDYIHSFFQKMNGIEFIGFSANNYIEKVRFIYIFSKYFRSKTHIFHIVSKIFLYIQRMLKYNRLKDISLEIRKGPNWVSVTNRFVEYLIHNKHDVMKIFKYSKSPDEYYKQTLAFNSTFIENVFTKEDGYKSCLREIDWDRGSPYVWRNSDTELLINSEKLFARKFTDFEINVVLCIKNHVMNNNP